MKARRRHRRTEPETPPQQAEVRTTRIGARWIAPFVVGTVLGAACTFYSRPRPAEGKPLPAQVDDLPSLGDLSLMTSDELNKQDVALLNLRCADGLPGAEDLNVASHLKTLKKWT